MYGKDGTPCANGRWIPGFTSLDKLPLTFWLDLSSAGRAWPIQHCLWQWGWYAPAPDGRQFW